VSFIDELKRRKVFRVAATYAVVAWILMQIGEVTFPALNIPEWVMSTLVVLLLAGFPIAVIFAWVFDKTPQGYIKTDAPDTENISGMNVKVDDRPFYLQKRNIFLALGVIGGILIGTYGGDSFKKSIDDKSIAVLPFDNFSKDKDDEYLSDGITEDITMNLAKVKELTVISRTSVMKYKGSTKNIREIADELDVKFILEGSIRKIGERVRIVGQLIDADNDKHIWSDSYDRNMVDIFDIQADVSKEIANAMEAELTDKTVAQIESAPTNNLEAYIVYQRARSYYGMYTNDANETAINLFNEALSIDNQYALAYAGLSDCYGQRVIRFNYDRSWIDSALYFADLALEINPNSEEAYKAKGLGYMALDMVKLAEHNNDKALEINPGYYTAVANKGVMLFSKGDLFDSRNFLNKSITLNPTSTATEFIHLSEIYYLLDQHEKSDEYLFKAIKHSPNVISSYVRGFDMSLRLGDFNKAKMIIDKFQENIGDENQLSFFNGLIFYFNGDPKTAMSFLNAKNVVSQSWRPNGWHGLSNAVFIMKGLNELNKSTLILYNDGKKYYERLILEGSDSPGLYVNLAAVEVIANNEKVALNLLEKAVLLGLRNKYTLNDKVFEKLKNNDRFKLIISEIDIFIQREKLKFNKARLIPSI
jgi:TolB-like protein/Tfp pilus assembly protein PilF